MDCISIGDSFHRRSGSSRRDSNRRSCSSSDTENQYLRSMIPSSTRRRSKIGAWWRKRRYSSDVANPITRSTPARLYHERSKMTISPFVGNFSTYRWKYHCPCSREFGAGRASMRHVLGLRYWVIRLMAEPLPAASRPSMMMTKRAPVETTHCCISTSSACRRLSSFS